MKFKIYIKTQYIKQVQRMSAAEVIILMREINIANMLKARKNIRNV